MVKQPEEDFMVFKIYNFFNLMRVYADLYFILIYIQFIEQFSEEVNLIKIRDVGTHSVLCP